ncbi:MAG: hypothetical protein HYX67_07765 [Candidatus Melainabacteria bacterium]|nr:hypothetical protein [Candidatus Melainabacteria bacterium]
MPTEIPPEILRSCSLLGLKGPPQNHDVRTVMQAWERRKLHCSTSKTWRKLAEQVDSAKETLIRWLQDGGDRSQYSLVPKKPYPSSRGDTVALPLPETDSET